MTERKRGRAGVEQRKRRLMAEPLCRHCAAKGRVTAATVPDHIIPLAFGGTDDDSNIQCLCDECHEIKTAIESAHVEGAANHPEWLKPSAIPLTIICGPPCAGKTTHSQQHASAADTIIDLDSIFADLEPTYRPWSGATPKLLLDQGIRARNAILGSLSRKTSGQAWFIVSAPTEAERGWWAEKLGGTTLLLDPGKAECKRRAMARGTPKAAAGIDEWHQAAARPWRKESKVKQTIGVDGWPV